LGDKGYRLFLPAGALTEILSKVLDDDILQDRRLPVAYVIVDDLVEGAKAVEVAVEELVLCISLAVRCMQANMLLGSNDYAHGVPSERS